MMIELNDDKTSKEKFLISITFTEGYTYLKESFNRIMKVY